MFWRSVFDLLGFSGDSVSSPITTGAPVVNPATGLPMLDDCLGGFDVGGSPFGIDIHQGSIGEMGTTADSNWWD